MNGTRDTSGPRRDDSGDIVRTSAANSASNSSGAFTSISLTTAGDGASPTRLIPVERSQSPSAPAAPSQVDQTAATISQDNSVSTADPVVQALLQQLEYAKPQVTDNSNSHTPQVTSIGLPGSEQSSSTSPAALIVILLVVVAGGYWWITHKHKKQHAGSSSSSSSTEEGGRHVVEPSN